MRESRLKVGLAVVVGAAMLLTASCGRDRRVVRQSVSTDATSTTTTSTTTSTTTTSTTTTATPATTLPGNHDIAVAQAKLTAMHYDPGAVSGKAGALYRHAIIAFQKVQGLKRSGRVTPDVTNAMNAPRQPLPARPQAGMHVEVDIPNQYLVVYQDDRAMRILPVSTGMGGRWHTPRGDFKFFTHISGQHTSNLGELWNPVYFDGGIAVHGEPSVPAYPASHGCVRIPMGDSVWFFDAVKIGTPIFVSSDPLPMVQELTGPMI